MMMNYNILKTLIHESVQIINRKLSCLINIRVEKIFQYKMHMLTDKCTWRSGVARSSSCNHHNKDWIRKSYLIYAKSRGNF